MPELPEVETVVRDLQQMCVGLRLVELEIFDQRVWFESECAPCAFAGRTVRGVHRRGKYIAWDFDGLFLVQHLRMTGKVLPAESPRIPTHKRAGSSPQIRLRWRFAERDFVFYDMRRFGTVTGVKDLTAFWLRKRQAPDPFVAADRVAAEKHFVDQLQRARRPLKSALLDQKVLSGGGIFMRTKLCTVAVFTRCVLRMN